MDQHGACTQLCLTLPQWVSASTWMRQGNTHITPHTIPDCLLFCSGMHASLCGGSNSAIRISGHESKSAATLQSGCRADMFKTKHQPCRLAHCYPEMAQQNLAWTLALHCKQQSSHLVATACPCPGAWDLALHMPQHMQQATPSPIHPIPKCNSPGHEPDGMHECSEAFETDHCSGGQLAGQDTASHTHRPPQQAGLRGQHCCNQKLVARRGKLSAKRMLGCACSASQQPHRMADKLHPARTEARPTETGHSRPPVGSRVVRAATKRRGW